MGGKIGGFIIRTFVGSQMSQPAVWERGRPLKKAEGSILEFETDNLCETCRVAHKCAKLMNIARVVETLEITTLDNWGMDVDVFFNINDCPQYRMPFDDEVNGV
jgi:hypothetical protein